MSSITLQTGVGKKFKVCSCHYDLVKDRRWNSDKQGYIQSRHKNSTVKIHRIITDAPKELDVDHINGDVTDNRCSNLRLCTASTNTANSRLRSDNKTGFRGVFFDKKKWVCRIGFQNQKLYFGRFETAEEAARKYDEEIIKLFGEFARLNFKGVN